MKNKLVFLAILVVIAAIAGAVVYSRSIREQIDSASAVQPGTEIRQDGTSTGPSDGIGGMSISGMHIVQGEQGHELWNLVADAAVMSEEGGDIVAQNPYLTYYMYDDEGGRENLYVKSQSGDVNQKDNMIRFVGDVVVTHLEDELTTSVIIYNGPENRLDCPEKSNMNSPGMRGTANTMSWHLDDNTLHASGGVDLDLDTSRSISPKGRQNENE